MKHLIALGLAALAVLPPLSPQRLQQQATHVLVADVKAVYSREVHRRDDFVDTRYVAEVEALRVEKGKDVKPGTLVYVRYWQARQRPKGWAGPAGQNRLPQVGNQVRLYLRRAANGGFDVLEPNGVESLAVYGAR